jgi:ribose transport system permease protein
MPIIIAGFVFVVVSIMLRRTRYGEYIYLLGDNPVAARLAGINTDRMITLVYVISGLCAALAGLILIARLDSAQPVIGQGYEFNAIAAVVVGGTSFSGGEGTLFGTLLGTLLIETLGNGLNLLNVSPLWEQVVKGVVIALALLSYKALNRSTQ